MGCPGGHLGCAWNTVANGATLGPNPPCSSTRRNLLPELALVFRDPTITTPSGASDQQRVTGVLAAAATNISEEIRVPGISKLTRAAARAYHANPGVTSYPLDAVVNPAVSTAQAARNVLANPRTLNPQLRSAVNGSMSDSGDSDDEHYSERMFDLTEARPGKARKRKDHLPLSGTIGL